MIEMKQVAKSFVVQGRRVPILSIPRWTVDAGERIALTGPSGSGKSSLLHLLSGVMTADSGEILVAGHALHRFTEAQRDRFRARQVGYIFQDFHLLPSLTARQNVAMTMPGNWSKRERSEQEEAWFERVGLADRRHHLPGQLSRGQQQRVAIVRALIAKPPLVLADEPTGSLDWETAGSIMELLLDLCAAEKLTLATVTHDLHLAQMYPKQLHIAELNAKGRGDEATAGSGQEGEQAG